MGHGGPLSPSVVCNRFSFGVHVPSPYNRLVTTRRSQGSRTRKGTSDPGKPLDRQTSRQSLDDLSRKGQSETLKRRGTNKKIDAMNENIEKMIENVGKMKIRASFRMSWNIRNAMK